MKFWPIYLALSVSAIGCAVAVWFGVIASVAAGFRFLDMSYENYPPEVHSYLELVSNGVLLALAVFLLQVVALVLVYMAQRKARHLTRNCSGSNFAALN